MVVTDVTVAIWTIIIFIVMAIGIITPLREWLFDSTNIWIENIKRRRRLFKRHSNHIKKYDWLKLCSLAVVILFALIIVSGVLSHFGAVAKAKNVCYARLETKECNTIDEHEYFIPGDTAHVFDFPYKLGIAYKCGCDDNTKTIIMNMAKKVKVEKETENEKSVLDKFIQWMMETDGTNNTT